MTIPANPLAHRPKPYAMTLGFLLVWISRCALIAGLSVALTDVLVPKQGLRSSFYALLLGCILAVLQRNEIRSLKTPQFIATASGVSHKPFVVRVLPYAIAICAVLAFRQAAHAGPVNWANVGIWAIVAVLGGWATKLSLRFLPAQATFDRDLLEPPLGGQHN